MQQKCEWTLFHSIFYSWEYCTYSGIKMITWEIVETTHHLPEYKCRNQITAIFQVVNILTEFLKQQSSTTIWQIPATISVLEHYKPSLQWNFLTLDQRTHVLNTC